MRLRIGYIDGLGPDRGVVPVMVAPHIVHASDYVKV